MRKQYLIIIALLWLCGNASAQDTSYPQVPFQQLKSDYRVVAVVAHVKVKSIKYVAPDVHALYLVQSEVVEPFKGRIRRGQALEFYLHAEEDYDVNRFLGERIVFLEGSSNSPSGRWRLFVLENSSLPPSKKIVANLRKIKSASRSGKKRRSLTL